MHATTDRPAGKSQGEGRDIPRCYIAAAIVAVGFLCLVWGGFSVCHGFFPGRILRDAYEGAKALKASLAAKEETHSPDLWCLVRFGKRGVTTLDRARACPGYTLYTSGHAEGAFLVDLDGRVAHQWSLPYEKVWDPSGEVSAPCPSNRVFWFKAHLFPNGDLLAVIEGNGVTPWGQGIVRMDRDSKLVWKFLEHAHHDFSVGEDGRIYGLTHRLRTAPLPGLELQLPVVEDFVVVLSPDGVKLAEVSLLEAFANSRFKHYIDLKLSERMPLQRIGLSLTCRSSNGEYLHTNAARVIRKETAKRFPFARPGQVCVSFLITGLGMVGMVDMEQRSLVWAMVGPWRTQHDPDFLDNGHILLFDNYGNLSGNGYSRVIEIDPLTSRVVWSYEGKPGNILQSGKRSGQQRLPNGNTLITESDAGRIIEVTGSGEIVWEFINPVRSGEGDSLIPVISTGERLAAESLDDSFRERLADGRTKQGDR